MGNIKGQAIVEAAIVLPLLLVLAFGIVDFGRAIYTKSTLYNAARSGARVAVVTSSLTPISSSSSFSMTGEPANTIKKSILDGIPKDDSVQCELKILDSVGAPITGTAITGNQIQVTLTWPNFPMITPLSGTDNQFRI